VPGKRTLLGLYMWDFGTRRPMPLDRMKKQCALALKWLQEGRIEGMIFLATSIDRHGKDGRLSLRESSVLWRSERQPLLFRRSQPAP